MARRPTRRRGPDRPTPEVVVDTPNPTSNPISTKRVVSHVEFWGVYHYLTEGIIAGTELAPYYSDKEIEWSCQFQVKLRQLMEEGIIPSIQGVEKSAHERVSEVNYLSVHKTIDSRGRSKSNRRRILAFRLPNPNHHGEGAGA